MICPTCGTFISQIRRYTTVGRQVKFYVSGSSRVYCGKVINIDIYDNLVIMCDQLNATIEPIDIKIIVSSSQ